MGLGGEMGGEGTSGEGITGGEWMVGEDTRWEGRGE